MRKLLRIFGRTRRRFSSLPHWAKDLYALVSYVNFVELVPTVVSIGMAPRHFFRRLPLTLKGQRSHYQTPIKFFFNFAALFISLIYLRHGDLSEVVAQSDALMYLPLMIPLTPPLMILLGSATWLLFQVPRLAPNGDAFPPPNHGPFQLLLSPRTYMNLDAGRFFWGLFYISIYFLAAWQIVQVLIALNFLGVVQMVSMLGDGHEVAKAITIMLGIALAAFSIHGLVLTPYMEMLRATMRRPTKPVFETDVFEIAQCVKKFLSFSDNDPTLDAQATILCKRIMHETEQLVRVLVIQKQDMEISQADLEEQIKIHRKAFQVAKLREKLQRVSAGNQQAIERILTGFDPQPEQSLLQAA